MATSNLVGARLAVYMVLLSVLIVCSCTPSLSQVAGATLSGLIMDNSGATIANAAVSVKNVATGVVRDATTNEGGFYSVPNLLPGSYEVTVEAQGFTRTIQKGVTLNVGAQQALNISLKPGQVKELVEVTS